VSALLWNCCLIGDIFAHNQEQANVYTLPVYTIFQHSDSSTLADMQQVPELNTALLVTGSTIRQHNMPPPSSEISTDDACTNHIYQHTIF